MADIVLKGITWNHSRGITPLLAASQRFHELHPQVEIQWSKRTLQQFADYPIEELTKSYDLLIIDHPWVGTAAATNCVLPLEKYLDAHYLQDQLQNSVGPSHISYEYDTHQWALAIDAAAPFASYRKDLFEAHQVAIPQTWEEVIALAEQGKVAAPAIPIDLLMNFYTFCIANGQTPFVHQTEVIDTATGVAALEMMYSLYRLLDKSMFDKNPIAVANAMSGTNDYWYCPFAYGYSNYARAGYAKHTLYYTDVIRLNNKHLQTTIGGTGLSVSAFSEHKEIAVAFAEMVCAGSTQAGLYVQSGGQPGHLKAWTDTLSNAITHNFFQANLPAMQRGYMRPRYHGYLHFQDHAGDPIRDYLMGKTSSPLEVLAALNNIYHQSLAPTVCS